MRSFWNLVGFEYKKIFRRRSAIIALVLATAVICAYPLMIFLGIAYVDGEPFESHYQAMTKDRAYALALSGRALDETLFAEAKDAYTTISADPAERSAFVSEYQRYARPYYEVYRMMRAAYDLRDMENIRNLTEADMRGYYQARHHEVAANIRRGANSAAAKDMLIKLDGEIETPFVFAYSDGFDRLMGGVYTIGTVCAFALAVCLAPMFAGEYSTRADQLLLSSKFGKNKLIPAKMFTAISLTAVFFTLLVFITVIGCMMVYGYDGADAPFQLIFSDCVYPLTIFQSLLIYTVCAFCGTLLIAALTLLLSSKFKSPFGVIIVISVLLIVPMLLNVPETNVPLYNLSSLLPTNMMSVWGVFPHVPFDFFGLIILPYVFLPIFAIAASAAALPFARRAFRNHQIG